MLSIIDLMGDIASHPLYGVRAPSNHRPPPATVNYRPMDWSGCLIRQYEGLSLSRFFIAKKSSLIKSIY
jgi:hypothetical protein